MLNINRVKDTENANYVPVSKTSTEIVTTGRV